MGARRASEELARCLVANRLLEHQVAELQKLNAKLQQEMVLRAAPTFSELIDALENLIRGAEQGNADAKAALVKFHALLMRVSDAASVLTVVRA